MEITLKLNSKESKDLTSYCNLNNLKPEDIVKKSYLEGFMIEKYGLLNNGGTEIKEVVKEVIVEKRIEIPVETIKEVVKIEYVDVPVEVVKYVDKEVIKEVPVEKVVTKIEYIRDNDSENKEIEELKRSLEELSNKPPIEKIVEVIVEKESDNSGLKSKLEALQTTLGKVRQETLEKDKKIKELEQTILDIQKLQENKKAVYLKGSNLDKTL